jgi:hypothetical protein
VGSAHLLYVPQALKPGMVYYLQQFRLGKFDKAIYGIIDDLALNIHVCRYMGINPILY